MVKMGKARLTVIIPCWNCSLEIGEMLDSILQQSYKDWLVFCVDDQSTDETISVISSYSKKDSRIRLVKRSREPKGAQTCRNIGFDLSDGSEFVIWFDSDDIIAPYCFEQRVNFMDCHPDIDFGVFKAKSFNYECWEEKNSALYGFKYLHCADICRFVRRTLPFVVWNNIYRRSSLIRSGLVWDEKLQSLQDSDFNIQALLKGLRYEYADNARIDYFWRINPNKNSISNKISTKPHQQSHIYFYNKLCSSLSTIENIKYLIELDDYLLFLIDNQSADRWFVKQLLQTERFRCRPYFRARIICYSLLRRHFRNILFPVVTNYKRIYNKKYYNYAHNLLLKCLYESPEFRALYT